jgi:SnoaL-like domain
VDGRDKPGHDDCSCGNHAQGQPVLVDFEVVLAANFAEMIDIGAHGFREYFGAADDFEAGGRQGPDHILIGSAEGRNFGWEREMDDRALRAALQRHWDASDANDFTAEHEIYREDAVLDYPQSGERIRGRHNIQESRFVQPNKKRFAVRRIVGGGNLWITEFVLSYDGVPSYAVSIMEFRDGLVANETQYFADRFEPAPSRAHLVERAGGAASS